MYREGQCIDGPHPCPHLSECDQHYIEETGDWDYSDPLAIEIPKKAKRKNRNGLRKAAGSLGRISDRRRRNLIKKGLASRLPIKTNLAQALEALK
jgi:hypothetical protein